MSNIRVYSKKNCVNCDALKNLLDKKSIIYNTVRIDTPEALTELRVNGVFTMSAPVLQIDNKFFTMEDMIASNMSNQNAAMVIIDQNKIMDIIENDLLGVQQQDNIE